MNVKALLTILAMLLLLQAPAGFADDHAMPWVTYPGGDGPGKGKHVVLISGDEEYRSEEALPQLGKILSVHHGFKCTVLFAITDGYIDPNNRGNIPGLEALKDADLMVVALRFRDLPDDQMKHIDDYLKTGKPVIGMRTSTHAFNIGKDKTYSHYSWRNGGDENGAWEKGFGHFVLGETWVAHHGIHKGEGTNGVIVEKENKHPILAGIKDGDVWGDTDVYTINLPLPEGSVPLVLGQVVKGLKPGGEASGRVIKKTGKPVNDPMMPVSWTKPYQVPGGKKGMVFTTTMGSSTDLQYMGTRRMLVNASYYLLGMDVPSSGTKADLVGTYEPTMYAFKRDKNYWKNKGLRPSDFALEK